MKEANAKVSYSAIDSVIAAWTKKHGFTIFDRMGGRASDFRSVYLSSPDGECFQIWIDEPASGFVSLHAANVETRNDEELRKDWSVPTEQLPSALEDAVMHVRSWMDRN